MIIFFREPLKVRAHTKEAGWVDQPGKCVMHSTCYVEVTELSKVREKGILSYSPGPQGACRPIKTIKSFTSNGCNRRRNVAHGINYVQTTYYESSQEREVSFSWRDQKKFP